MSEALAETGDNRFWGCIQPYPNRDEIVGEICERLLAGEPLAQICRSEGMPNTVQVWRWSLADPAIGQAIAHSREFGADAIALEALTIADNLTGDPQRDKLRVETRLKLLAKWNPKKYGDAMQLKHADANGEKIDNSTLVSELLNLMPANAQPVIEARARNVTPAPVKSVYRPRIAPKPTDVDDLV